MDYTTHETKTKVCTKCKRELPATTDYFHRLKKSKDGLKYSCKECRNEQNTEYRKNNIETVRKKSREIARRDKEKRSKYQKEYRKKYPERRRKTVLKHREKHHDKILAYQRKYREEHKEKIKAKDQERKKTKKYKLQRIKDQRIRESRKKKLESNFSVRDWIDTMAHFDNKCAYCGTEEKLEQEHFIPISKGGEYTKNNIIPSCNRCNVSKLNRNFFEWYPNQPYYSKKREKKILRYLNYDGNEQQMALTL